MNSLHFDKDLLLFDLPFLFAHLLEVVCAHDAHQLVLEAGCGVKSLAEYVLHLFKFEFLGQKNSYGTDLRHPLHRGMVIHKHGIDPPQLIKFIVLAQKDLIETFKRLGHEPARQKYYCLKAIGCRYNLEHFIDFKISDNLLVKLPQNGYFQRTPKGIVQV